MTTSKPVQFKVNAIDKITRDFDGGTVQLRCGTDPIPVRVYLKNGGIAVGPKDDTSEIVEWDCTGKLIGTINKHPFDIVFATKVFVLISGAWDMQIGDVRATGHLFIASNKWYATYVKDGQVVSSEVDKNGRFVDGYLIRKL